jgi:hypothetical protein
MRGARALATTWLACAAITGCHVFDESKLDAATQGDGAIDAGARDAGAQDAGLDAGPSCEPRQPPPRPSLADSGDVEAAFALRDIRLDQRAVRWRTVGYDLDGLCSEPGAPALECDPPATPPGEPVDGEDGVDNAFGQWISPLLLFLVPSIEEQARSEQESGNLAFLLQLREWNGTEDDPHVEAVVSQSASATDEAGDPSLRWDGTDRWWSRRDSFLDGDPAQPLLVDDNAYVAGGTLVVTLPLRSELVIPGGDARLRLRLTDTVLSARIEGSGAELGDVTIAGRWALIDVAAAASELGLCTPTDRSALVDLGEEAADVRSTPGTGGEGVPCNAVSVGIELTGVRMQWEGLQDGEPLTDPCPP